MLYIIDGTGSDNDYIYAKEMTNGFCAQLQRKTNTPHYLRGPDLLGRKTEDIAETMLSRIQPGKIFLAGHSRGGAAVIWIANKLKAQGKTVDAMFLYDAVDCTVFLSGVDKIPSNVRACYHARRDESLAGYYELDALNATRNYFSALHSKKSPAELHRLRNAAIQLNEWDRKMRLCMRTNFSPIVKLEWKKLGNKVIQLFTEQRYLTTDDFFDEFFNYDNFNVNFGNCGIDRDPPCNYFESKFQGSHGAIGGAPIVDERATRELRDFDRGAVTAVDAWMSSKLIAEEVLNGSHFVCRPVNAALVL